MDESFEKDINLLTKVKAKIMFNINKERQLDEAPLIYEDISFTKIAAADHSITAPDPVYVGVVGSNFGNSGYVVQVQDCWITPDNDPTNTVRYNVITSGCEDAAVR